MSSIPHAGVEEDGLPSPRRHLAIAVMLASLVLVVLDGAIANVALPSIAQALRVTPGASVWVLTAYQLGVVVALLPCAALGESLGGRRVFVGGIALFTAASALCALSPSLPALAGARFLQGIGGGAIMALGTMMLRFACPHRLMGRVIAWNAMAIALSSAAGPGVGAAILAMADWPLLFAINLPIGGLVLLAYRALPRLAGTGRPLDRGSAVLNAAMFVMVVIGTDMVVTRPAAASLLVAGAVLCLVALIRRERTREAPLIPIDLLRDGSFRLAAIASVCCFTGQMMGLVALPFYLQHVLGQSIVATGAYMMPWPLAVMCAAPISARLAGRVPTAVLCAGGAVCLAVGLLLAGCWPMGHGLLPLVIGTAFAGAGFGIFQTANNRVLLLSAPKARSGAAGGAQGTARLLGQTVGSVAMSLLFACAAPPQVGLAVGAGGALLAGLVSLLRRRHEVAVAA